MKWKKALKVTYEADIFNRGNKYKQYFVEELTREAILITVRFYILELRECYENAMVKSGEFSSHVVVHIFIGEDGTVSDVSVEKATHPDPLFHECIEDTVFMWKFPVEEDPSPRIIEFPFHFRPSTKIDTGLPAGKGLTTL